MSFAENEDMTELALRSGRTLIAFWSARLAPNGRKLAVLALIALVISSSADLAEVVMQAMSDAYLQVTVFVATTLALFYSAERMLKVDLGEVMARRIGWQPAIAAVLGAAARLWRCHYRRYAIHPRLCQFRRIDIGAGCDDGRCGVPARGARADERAVDHGDQPFSRYADRLDRR